ncbi:EAL domain-containing protein [Colwellia sp. RSH04]|uniref:EAL domain-containing response regulator n=1 Tax=Colwellia sp. RSH04 TaxID=2305464 RepID=UPI000E572B1E|nr:EAL domain-containing response regulator [Colwellia sp. RSH04]RHW76134.1 EAL domain-containing protein [Colwellia sp. RSH04]
MNIQMDLASKTKDYEWLNALLIDDSTVILDYVAKVLEDSFNISNCHKATSSAEAIQVLRSSKSINLLFLDLNMPNVDGIQFLEKLSQINYKGYVVIMSGVSTQIISSVESLTKNYGLNYIGTLLKPMHESDFVNIINKIGTSRKKFQSSDSLKTYEIIRAIKNDDIEVMYQPQIELASRKFMGVEALCRMVHPRLGMISPDRFIDKAEESELIIHITLAVLKIAFGDWKKWSMNGLDLKLSVNVSPISLQQPEFADTIFMLLSQFAMPADKLCIEITEGALANDPLQELANLNRLSMRGVALAFDDFGQNNSTIERLQKFPVNYLKLDKSYFIEQKGQLNQLALINSTLSIAKELHIKTIAEGVEDSAVMSLVTDMGCDYGQGYYISKPMKAKDVLAWQREWNAKT